MGGWLEGSAAACDAEMKSKYGYGGHINIHHFSASGVVIQECTLHLGGCLLWTIQNRSFSTARGCRFQDRSDHDRHDRRSSIDSTATYDNYAIKHSMINKPSEKDLTRISHVHLTKVILLG